MSEEFVRVHICAGDIKVERGIPAAFCSHSFRVGSDGYIDNGDLHELVKLLQQALDGKEWEGVEYDDS